MSLLALSARAGAADPTTSDCLAANDSSIALRNGHKLLAARAQLLICAAATCPVDIRNECARRVADVNAAMPTIVFKAEDTSGADLSAVSVTMDGQLLAAHLDGTALSIDPGEHSFVFETSGQPSLTKHFVIAEAQKGRREAIVFGVGSQSPAARTETRPAITAPSPADQATADKHGLGTQKTVAIAAASVGAVGVAVGAVFGAMAMSRKSEAQKTCPDACTDQGGVDEWSSAKNAGTISTLAFIVGGVGLAGGAALWFTASPESSGNQSVSLGVGPGSLQLRGMW